MTPEQQDFTQGEIVRALSRVEKSLEEMRTEVRDRHHRLSNDVNAMIAPLSILKTQMKSAEDNLVRLDGAVNQSEHEMRELDAKVNGVVGRAAWLSGAMATLGLLAQLAPWPWKRP